VSGVLFGGIMKLQNTRIYRYLDFLQFLKDSFCELKESDKKYSHRFISNALGINSSGWIADVLAGRRRVSRNQLLKLSQLLDLDSKEEEFFQLLADYSQAETEKDAQKILEKILSFQELPKELIDEDRFEYFSKWYYAAIRELLLINSFKGDYQSLAHSLIPSITESEAMESIRLLERLGLIKKFAGGIYKPVNDYVKKEKGGNRTYYYQFMKTSMRLGLDALEDIPRDERDVSALVLNLSENSLNEVREDIKNLRKKMIQLSEQDQQNPRKQKNAIRVYESIFQIFPVSLKIG
jgi:uncharacterized protein (TIGR02147 family)